MFCNFFVAYGGMGVGQDGVWTGECAEGGERKKKEDKLEFLSGTT